MSILAILSLFIGFAGDFSFQQVDVLTCVRISDAILAASASVDLTFGGSTININLSPKQQGHPYYQQGNADGYTVNGVAVSIPQFWDSIHLDSKTTYWKL